MIDDVVIIGGGHPKDWPSLDFYKKKSTVFIGVDRGTLYGLKAGFPIDKAVGDFDSLNEEEWLFVSDNVSDIERCQSEKDDTDMELGVLSALQTYPNANIILIGATGGRLDHYLSNLWLPLQERFMPILEQITLLDRLNSVSYFKPGNHTIKKDRDKTYLAYICLTPVEKLSLYDAKYQLDKVDFLYPRSLSSNEFIGKTSSFSFDTGIMSVIQSKDELKQ